MAPIRTSIDPLYNHDVFTSVYSPSTDSSRNYSTASTVDIYLDDTELEGELESLSDFEDVVVEKDMELDNVEERENIFMDNRNNRDPFPYFYDLYLFDACSGFETEEEEGVGLL